MPFFCCYQQHVRMLNSISSTAANLMPLKSKSESRLENYKHFFRERLSYVDALPQLAILSLITGLLTALVILIFRWCIETTLSFYLPEANSENFEALSTTMRMALPLGGAFVIAVVWYKMRINQRKVGVAYVMERLAYHQGYMSFKSLLTQFFGGVMTIISGQSSGREGPAVHLGSASASLLGQYLKLPNNSIRILIACGTASAISASFNTPIAGVIFAMEVVMMEYSIIGFTPVIIASVSAAFLSHAVYGPEPAFFVPQLYLNSPLEIPYIVFCGLVIGLSSAFFVRLMLFSMKISHVSIFYRIMLAGGITAAIAYVFPEIMGIGYDTVNHTFTGQIGLGLLCGIAVAKLIATSTSIGLGMPNGIIGPTLFIGATIGGALGIIANWLMPGLASSSGFYAMLGMGAMMGSVLQAPLAALMALLELTQNPNIILPGMLIIVVSSMFASQAFKQKSIFLSILESQGLNYNHNPTLQALRRISVGAIMESKFTKAKKQITVLEAESALRQNPVWIIIENDEGTPISLLPAADLARYLTAEKPEDKAIKLLEIPAQRRDLAPIYSQATLEEALKLFTEKNIEALYVERRRVDYVRTLGVITRADIDNYYQYKGN